MAVALATAPDRPFGPDGRSALTKLLEAMPDAQREATGDLAGRLWIRLPSTAGRPPATVSSTVGVAVPIRGRPTHVDSGSHGVVSWK